MASTNWGECMATETKTFYPGAYLTSDYNFASIDNETNPVGKGSSNTTYAMIGLVSGSFSKTWVYWPFDLSAIPNNATIDSVSCYAKGKTTNTNSSYTPKRTMQLYAGTTPKDSAVDFGYNATVLSLSGGTWTRDELRECRLKLYVERGSSNSYIYIYFYGADLTVTYTYQSEKFMLKLGGAWHDIARVFKKVNGIWVEQTDLANVIEDGVRYQNGGEIISPKKTVTITGSGDATYSYVKINGVTYTSPATVEVGVGDVIEATVERGGFGAGNPRISVDGVQKVSTAGTYKHTVNSDCTVALDFINKGAIYYGTIAITTS